MQVNISNKLLPLIFSFQIWKLFRIYLILIYARLILFHDKNTFMLNRHLSFLLKCRLIYWKLFLEMLLREAVFQRCFVKKVLFEILQNSQVFSCEFCKISKNILSYRTPPAAASLLMNFSNVQNIHFTFNYLNSIWYRS